MPTFSELSTSLDKALKDVLVKKDAFDKASAAVASASNDYQNSLSVAAGLRDQISLELDKVLPNNSGRVRAA